jgi:hypothetical protein
MRDVADIQKRSWRMMGQRKRGRRGFVICTQYERAFGGLSRDVLHVRRVVDTGTGQNASS